MERNDAVHACGCGEGEENSGIEVIGGAVLRAWLRI
jgi:hypothetical protein